MGATNYPIATIVNIAYCSAVFAFRDIEKYRVYRGGVNKTPDIYLPYKLVMEAGLLEWRNNHYPNDELLPKQGNYVLGLCAQYLNEALRALGNAGGVVINPTTGNPINLAFYRSSFTIGQTGSLMDAGDTELTIPLSGFLLDSIDFFRSGVLSQYDDDSQLTYTVTYNPSYVIIHLNQAVQNGETYQITGLRATAGTIAGGGSGSGFTVPLPLEAGKFLTNDGSNLLWDDVWIPITSADFEDDGVTYTNSSLAGYYLGVEWINVPQWLDFEAGEATLIDGGGFIVNIPDFNAKQNPDWKFKIFKKSLP